MDYNDFLFNQTSFYQTQLRRKTKYEANAFNFRLTDEQKQLADNLVVRNKRNDKFVPSNIDELTRFSEGRVRMTFDDFTSAEKNVLRQMNDYSDLSKDLDNYMFFL